MSLDLLKAVPIIHVTLSSMKKAVLHDHHLIITTQTNTSLLTLMYRPVWSQYPIWCRYVEMQRCRYADMHQFPRVKSDTHKVELPTHLGSIVVQVCAWSHRSIFRQSDKLNHGSILYTVRNIVSLLFPPWGSQPWIMKQTNTLYIGCIFLGIRKNLNTTAQRFERNQTQKEHKKTQKP